MSIYVYSMSSQLIGLISWCEDHKISGNKHTYIKSLVIQSDLFGMVKWPFKGLSDLRLGHKKATAWITWRLLLIHSLHLQDGAP